MKTGWILAVKVVVLVALGGGLAYAVIPNSSGVIDGCYMKENGQLRVIDASNTTCRPSEQALQWNLQGVPGVPGPPGERGPSDVYFTGGSATNSLPVAGGFPGNYSVVATLSLPAGTYVLDASPYVRNDDPTTSAIARCIMFVNGQSVGAHVAALTPSQGGGPYFGNVSIKSVRMLPAAGTVAVACQKTDATTDPGYGSNLVFAEGNYLTAQAAGTSHEQ